MAQTNIATPSQSELRITGNEGLLYTPLISRTGASSSDIVLCHTHDNLAQSAGAVECTDCISVKGYDSLNECPGYDIKQSNGEGPFAWGCRIHRLHLCREARFSQWMSRVWH